MYVADKYAGSKDEKENGGGRPVPESHSFSSTKEGIKKGRRLRRPVKPVEREFAPASKCDEFR